MFLLEFKNTYITNIISSIGNLKQLIMNKRNFNKKLILKKSTISNLNNNAMNQVFGGAGTSSVIPTGSILSGPDEKQIIAPCAIPNDQPKTTSEVATVCEIDENTNLI